MLEVVVEVKKDFQQTSIEILNEQVVRVVLKREQEIGVEVAQYLHDFLQEIGLRVFKTLILLEDDVVILPSAKKWMSEPERTARSMADAFVIDSLAKRLIINFYIKHNKPQVPTRTFSSEQKALEWLREQETTA